MNTSVGLPSESGKEFSSRDLGWVGAFAGPLIFAPVWASNTPENWGFLGSMIGFQLLFLLAISTITDIRSRKIYNASTYSAILIVLTASVWTSLTHTHSGFLGATGIGSTIAGAAVCFFVVFLAYQMTGCGAGDVKMATVIGAILGWRLGLTAVGISYIVAAIAALGSVAWSIGPKRLVNLFGSAIAQSVFPRHMKNPKYADHQQLTSTIPMAPFFAVGTILAILELI